MDEYLRRDRESSSAGESVSEGSEADRNEIIALASCSGPKKQQHLPLFQH